MPFSIQHLQKKNKASQRKRRVNKRCYCKVCKGKRWLSSSVIKRHEESFGRSEQLSSDEELGFLPSSPKATKFIPSTIQLVDNLSDDSENTASHLYADEVDPINGDPNGAGSCDDQEAISLQPSENMVQEVPESDLESPSSNVGSDISASDDSESEGSDLEEHTVGNLFDIYSSTNASLPLFEGSPMTVLQVLAGFFAWFTDHPSASKSAMNDILILNKNILPQPNNLPGTYDKAYQFIKPFLLPSKVFHVCSNDCIIYRKTSRYDYSKLNVCPVCGSPRYANGGKKPNRTFIYYELGPRWKRMYGNTTIAEMLQKHQHEISDDSSIMTDVHNSPAWKTAFGAEGFSGGDARAIALQLSTDGVCPFNSNKVDYSMWPIMLNMLNLPKNVRNLFGHFILAGIIPAQKGGAEPFLLDPYLEVVVDELLELSGVEFYDSVSQASFEFKVTILNYVLDFPGLGKVFHAAGATALQACMWCELRGISLKSLDKVVFVGNRRFLPSNHELRQNEREFPWNKKENSPPPQKTENKELLCDALAHSKASNKTQAANIAKATGSKGVNCFMLLPEQDRPNQAFPDMMHTLKNVVATLFGLITGKGDSVKVRNGEKEVNRFKECWVDGKDSNKGKALPPAPFTLSKTDLKIADKKVSKISVPPGYGWKPSPIFTKKAYLKCHDWKQLAVDGILKYCLRGLLGEQQRRTFFELLDILTKMCSDIQDHKKLDQLQAETNLVLANVERDFPVSIQTISLHNLHHIIDGIRLYGPVHSWWMFSQERFNSWICQRVKNRRYPEATVMATYKIFDWVQFMRLSGQLQSLESTRNAGKKSSESLAHLKDDVYQLSKQERDAISFLTSTEIPLYCKRYTSMKCRCATTDKDLQYKSDSVVTLIQLLDTPLKVGIVKHFLTFSLPNKDSFVTLKVFKTTKVDNDSGLLYVDLSSEYDEQTVWPQSISGPCVTANDAEQNLLWVLNASSK